MSHTFVSRNNVLAHLYNACFLTVLMTLNSVNYCRKFYSFNKITKTRALSQVS